MLLCQDCRIEVGRRYRVTVNGMIGIAVLCDRCRNPEPERPAWLRRLRARDNTAAITGPSAA